MDKVLTRHPMTFRNDNGTAFVGGKILNEKNDLIIVNPRRITYGLFKGSGDRVGWEPVVITPGMVGLTVAVFLSIEVKTLNDRLSDDQKNWNEAVLRDGGIVELWRDTTAGLEIKRNWRTK